MTIHFCFSNGEKHRNPQTSMKFVKAVTLYYLWTVCAYVCSYAFTLEVGCRS